MSKIVKKKDLDVLIESTLEKVGIESPKEEVVTESKKSKEVISEAKELINEEMKNDLARFNKLSNYTYKK